MSPGDHPSPYPPATLLRDLLATLVASGELQEIAPGSYLDAASGVTISAGFRDADGNQEGAEEPLLDLYAADGHPPRIPGN